METCKKRRYALHIGAEKLKPENYLGSENKLSSVEPTIHFYKALLEGLHFDDKHNVSLIGEHATVKNVKSYLSEWAAELEHGDLLVINFVGHGTIYRDEDHEGVKRGQQWEERGWCFYDRIYFHFELWNLAISLKAGVRVVIISDSCYSGSLLSGMPAAASNYTKYMYQDLVGERKDLYGKVLHNKNRFKQYHVPAAIAILSSSSMNGKAYERKKLTLFAEAFEHAWRVHESDQSYIKLFENIQRWIFKQTEDELGEKQRPRWHYYQGHSHTNLAHHHKIFY